MVTAEATASAIKGARDCGVHEFVRKPFTAGDVLKRIEVVATRQRDWIEAVGYVGPDRRRFNSGEYNGARKRKSDVAGKAAPAAVKDQAMRILASALNQFDSDPAQALRSIREQANALKQLAIKAADARLAVTVAALETTLTGPTPTKAMLTGPVGRVLELAAPDTFAKAG
jgi:DNA-binding response OmpR family regulator